MSEGEKTTAPTKSSIIDYVGNFIEKRDNEVRQATGDTATTQAPRGVDRDRIVVDTDQDGFSGDISVSSLENIDKLILEF